MQGNAEGLCRETADLLFDGSQADGDSLTVEINKEAFELPQDQNKLQTSDLFGTGKEAFQKTILIDSSPEDVNNLDAAVRKHILPEDTEAAKQKLMNSNKGTSVFIGRYLGCLFYFFSYIITFVAQPIDCFYRNCK